MTKETIWKWLQSKGKTFRVISNADNGTIEVLNEKGETLVRKKNLSKRQVEHIERTFLSSIATKISHEPEPSPQKPKDSFDPMVA